MAGQGVDSSKQLEGLCWGNQGNIAYGESWGLDLPIGAKVDQSGNIKTNSNTKLFILAAVF
jgi:hypothetical protein